jgi:hypothetical protein
VSKTLLSLITYINILLIIIIITINDYTVVPGNIESVTTTTTTTSVVVVMELWGWLL